MRRCWAIGLLLPLLVSILAISPSGSASPNPAADPIYTQDNWLGSPTGTPPEVVTAPTTRYHSRENLAASDNVTLGPYYAENSSEAASFTTGTTYENKMIFAFTPPAAGNYLVIATSLIGHENTASAVRARFLRGTEVWGEVQYDPRDSSLENYPFATHKAVFLSDPTTFLLQFCSGPTATARAVMRNARIILFRVADFYQIENAAGGSTPFTTYVDVDPPLTFTPPAGEYLILSTANFTSSATTISGVVRVYDVTENVSLGESPIEPEFIGENHTFILMKKLTLPAAPRTLKLQFCVSATGTAYINNVRLTAVRIDSLATYVYENVDADASDNTGTWIDRVVCDFSAPFSDNYLIMATALIRRNYADARVWARLLVDGTAQDFVEHRAKDVTDYISYHTAKIVFLTAGSHTLKLQWSNAASAATHAHIKEARVIAIRLPQLPTSTGYLESSIIDAGSNSVEWENIEWENAGGPATVKVRVSRADNNPYDGPENWTSWTAFDNGADLPYVDNRYLQYRIELTGSPATPPSLNWIRVYYTYKPPTASSPTSPAAYVQDNDNTPTFTWEVSPNCDNHRLEIDNDRDFSSPIDNRLLPPDTTSYTLGTLPGDNILPDDNYYWRVVGWALGGDNLGPTRQLIIDTLTPGITFSLRPSSPRTLTYSGGVADERTPIVLLQYRVDDGAWTDIPFTPEIRVSYSFTTPILPLGTRTVQLRVRDNAGNWSHAFDKATLVQGPLVPIHSIPAGQNRSADFRPFGIAVHEITVAAARTVENVRISIAEIEEPGLPAAPGVVWRYLDISVTNVSPADLAGGRIKFAVPRAWVGARNIDLGTIRLLRYELGWQALATRQVGSDAKNLYFEAESPGFSIFAIAGQGLVQAIFPTAVEPPAEFFALVAVTVVASGLAVVATLKPAPRKPVKVKRPPEKPVKVKPPKKPKAPLKKPSRYEREGWA